MSTYKIVNPSDPYTITADDRAVACVAVMLLGEGKYALKDEQDVTVLPLFLFGGDPEGWLLKEHSVANLGDFVNSRAGDIATALRTVKLPKGQRRSSLNDIGGRAKQLAKRFREIAAEYPQL